MHPLLSVLLSWFPMLLLIGVWIFFMRQMQSGGGKAMGFGKSKAKLLNEAVGKVTFDDVAGIDEAKQELEEVVEFLKDPQKFSRLGGKIPRGALLVGPPGTGKTLLARAIAGEANVPFFSISGSDFVEMFVGVGASRVRDMFDQGKKNAPCIVFIDEILKRFEKKFKDPRSFTDGKKIVKIITSFLKINCKLSELEERLLDFTKKNNLKKNIFRDFKSILNLKKLNQDINFIANFGRDVEYYTGIVFEVLSGKKEIARGGRYDDLLKSLGAKKNIPAVGAAINLKNI